MREEKIHRCMECGKVVREDAVICGECSKSARASLPAEERSRIRQWLAMIFIEREYASALQRALRG